MSGYPEDTFVDNTIEQQDADQPSVYEQLRTAEREISILNTAIVMLKKRLDQHGISYFENHVPFDKHPYDMNKKELLEANKTTTRRVAQNRQASTEYSIPMETPEALEERVTAEYEPNNIFEILQIANANGGAVTAEQLMEIIGKNGITAEQWAAGLGKKKK